MPAKGVFPTRGNCDPDDPEEFALWAFAAMPGVTGGQLIMPVEYFRHMSKRLWDLGFRQVEEPTLEYVGPSASEPNWATSAGRWIPAGSMTLEDKGIRDMESAVARMGHAQKVALFKALQAWENNQPIPDSKAGKVVEHMLATEPQLLPVALKVLRDAA